MNKRLGFTIVELVMVIILLGILAATALPRFVEVSGDTQAAVLNNMAGTLTTVSSMVYAEAALQGAKDELNGSVEYDGNTIDTHFGYPRSHWENTWQHVFNTNVEPLRVAKDVVCSTSQNFCAITFLRHGTPGYSNDWTIYFVPDGFAIDDNCYARYTLDVITTTPFLIATDAETSGCS